ncbi:hypothetical protein TrCOL_g4499 [Triparma columacea]|uniref:Nicotinate-nucleotide pyrophosphorylase [carboxylating] n=1 Tax=Triparma columacea TaxID=722753 RepID=A0A9W7GA28_9STRA|nr:hypothetical protein TrCOL_g4499 [Triparma columacea]
MDYSSSLHLTSIKSLCANWIADDIPSHFDIGGLVVGSRPAVAHLYMKQSGVLAGLPFFQETFNSLSGCVVTWCNQQTPTPNPDTSKYVTQPAVEGEKYTYDGRPILLAVVKGPVNQILRGERTALCALSRCSGVATDSRLMVDFARSINWNGSVAGTRKTTPGFRVVEKYGLMVGGADTHWLDLSHMVMLKDNHIWACNGDITECVRRACSGCGFSSKIEVECRSVSEALTACEAGADVVMLDNMKGEQAREAARVVKGKYKGVVVEVSGGITMETMGEYTGDDVDVVSCGKLTQEYQCLDFSLKIQQE